MTIDDIRTLLEQQDIKPNLNDVAAVGTVKNHANEDVEYTLYVGWDIIKANQCDRMWSIFNTNLIQFIRDKDYSKKELSEIESYIQIDDSHWDWLSKSCVYKTDEYKWFFLYAEDKPQAACIIYHPKKSTIHDGNIFYIEYIAVAPWNRKNPMVERELIGLGSIMIQFVVRYATTTLGLELGFALHSLPTATGFYERLGMLSFTQNDKDGLKFYEMPSQVATKYLEAS
ncbi:hypothetical protein ACK36K_00520 [Aeromonas veronii]